jgi:uncharacterized protein YkwD
MRAAVPLILATGCLVAALCTSPLTAPAAAKPRVDAKERAIVRAINRQRARHDLAKVKSSRRLARAADFHSWEMLDADFFAHESRDGSPFHVRVRRYVSYRMIGETLAMVGGCGKGSARRIVRMWMDSPGHRAILLSSSFRRIGLGKRTGDYGGNRACMVTADFASKK